MSWTTVPSPFDSGQTNGVCWADDLAEFAAAGFGGSTSYAIATSPDGATWTGESSPLDDGTGYAVVRATTLGLYVAVGVDNSNNGQIITSPDGIAWTLRTSPFSGDTPTCVACKESTGLLIAGVSQPSVHALAKSTNGTSWSAITSAIFDTKGANAIAYSPTHNRWIAVGFEFGVGSAVAYSDNDGTTWTAISPLPFPNPEAYNGVYYDSTSDQWFVLGADDSGATVAVSGDNGATWSMVDAPVDNQAYAVVRADVALALAGFGAHELAVSTDDGATWVADATSTPFDDQADCLAYSPTLDVAVVGGEGADVLAYGLPSLPTLGRVMIAFEDGPLEPNPTWVRIDGDAFPSSFVSGYDTQSGRQTLLAQTDTGTATVYVNDHAEGLFDPRNSSSPYFGLLDGKQILLQLHNPVTDVWESQFQGWIRNVSYDINGTAVNSDGDPINASIQLECVDVFDYLAGFGLTPGLAGVDPPAGSADGVWYAETSGQVDDRLIEIATDAHLDPSRYHFAQGNVGVQAIKYDPGESALVAMRDAADAEIPFIANICVDRFGKLRFHGRYSRFDPDDVSAEPVSQWDFQRWAVGDGKAIEADPTRAQMRVLSYSQGTDDTINVAGAWPKNIHEADMPGQFYADTTAITDYGQHAAPPMSDLLIASAPVTGNTPNQEAAAYAELLVKNQKDPRVSITALQIKTVHPDDSRASATWAVLTRSDISDIVNVKVGYPEGTGLAGSSPQDDYYIESRSLTVRPMDPGFDYVELNLGVSPAVWSMDTHGVFPPFS